MTDSEAAEVGLCATCLHVRRVESARGSVFYKCDRADGDQRFPKYPELPVRECEGHEPATDPG